MKAEKLIEEVRCACRPFYQSLDFAHGIEHGERVVLFALELQQREGGDVTLIEAGAWLHQYHDNLDELAALLENCSATPDQKSKLTEIVMLCRPQLISENAPLEARLVFDADALDLMGPTGIMREVLCNATYRKLDPKEAVQKAKETQAMFRERLFSQTAIKLASRHSDISLEFWASLQRWQDIPNLFDSL
jgi:HD superfamily phosphodiesterase